MAFSSDDRWAIHDLVARHGHLTDGGELERYDELFTADVVYDLSPFGAEPLHGVDAIIEAGRRLGDGNPVGHHVTNTVVTEDADGTVRARSKGFGVMADGTTGSVTYDDVVVRTDAGWRIAHRTVTPRRRPLGG